MTELIPGKRYRWTVEGTASPGGAYLELTGGYSINHHDLQDAEVDLLPDPLPTTPGSVVRCYQRTYLLMEDGWWHGPSGASVTPNIIERDATVLFDAGAPRA